ncbi:hypothetical protein [Pantoea sp. C2G6]|uniref:hypothetical protein n=1 Tax=Pantoea sp. C2G6 TaxID=3243084 RepID=UPI003EDB1E47
MLLKGMNDPLLKAYQHPKSRMMISRFRGLAGDRRLSDWQAFCILVTGFTNYWYVQAGRYTINVQLTKTRQFDFLHDFLHFTVTLDGLICDEHFRSPEFVLPRYEVPYEFCRWRNKRGYDALTTYVSKQGVKSHKGIFIASDVGPGDERVMKWEGVVNVYDKTFFSVANFNTTQAFLIKEISKAIQEGLIRHLSFYRDLFHYIFPTPAEARLQARDDRRYLAKR